MAIYLLRDNVLGVDIGSASDEVVKVLAVGAGTFTAYFTKAHYGKVYNIQCRVLPRARHFGRVLKDRIVDHPFPDYGDQPNILAAEGFATTNTSAQLQIRLFGQLGEYGRDAKASPCTSTWPGLRK